LGNGEISLVNTGLVVALALIAIAVLWITNATIGQFLTPPFWLLILGIVAFFSIRAFMKHRE
jgi:hypothetical protein